MQELNFYALGLRGFTPHEVQDIDANRKASYTISMMGTLNNKLRKKIEAQRLSIGLTTAIFLDLLNDFAVELEKDASVNEVISLIGIWRCKS